MSQAVDALPSRSTRAGALLTFLDDALSDDLMETMGQVSASAAELESGESDHDLGESEWESEDDGASMDDEDEDDGEGSSVDDEDSEDSEESGGEEEALSHALADSEDEHGQQGSCAWSTGMQGPGWLWEGGGMEGQGGMVFSPQSLARVIL